MSYCTPTDLEPLAHRKLKPFVDEEDVDAAGNPSPGKIRNARLQSFIDSAESSINASLAGYYVVPIDSVKSPVSFMILKGLVSDYVRAWLYVFNNDADLPKGVTRDFEGAQKALDEYAKGDGERPPAKFLPDAQLAHDSFSLATPNATDFSGMLTSVHISS